MSSDHLSQAIERVMHDEISDESDVRRASAANQRDFPYDRNEEAQVTRREFCNFLGLTSAALFVGSAGFAGKAIWDSKRAGTMPLVMIEGAVQLAPGTSLNFHYPTEKDTAILIRTQDGSYHAFGQQCTHLSCPVYFDRAHQRLECPCHEGGFDARTGQVLYGPPPRPLDQIELEIRGNGEIWAIARKVSGFEHNG